MHTRTAAIGVAAALYSTGGGMTSLRCQCSWSRLPYGWRSHGHDDLAAASNELKGYKGSIDIDKRQREKSHVK